MKVIPLTKGYAASVDDDDFGRLNAFKWCALVIRRRDGSVLHVYAVRWVAIAGEKRILQYMHRFITDVTDPKTHVDHENHDGLNNQRHNLRIATPMQNHGNQLKQSFPASSKFKGVYWDKQQRRWIAQLQTHGRSKKLGRFCSEEAAALAYDSAARELFGEFAQTNFLKDSPQNSMTSSIHK